MLHINPRDTIKTTTVDGGGFDEKGVSRSLGGNPQTGPFYVEGALPGDTLAIKINRIHLNRPSASSASSIVPVALTADYHRNAQPDDKVSGEWKLDLAHGTASLANPTERLKNYKVEAAIVLGTSIQYEIAEVADPQMNVVAKIKKAVLAQILK